MKMKTPTLCCALVAAAFSYSPTFAADETRTSNSAAAAAQSDISARTDATRLSRSDRNFLEKAAQSGMKEVTVSQAALPNLQNAQVRSFAEMMINDHSKGNSEMMALAARKGVSLPDKSNKEMKLDDKWSKADDDLDEDYMETMVSDHKKAIDLHEEAARSNDPEIAAHAQKMLPKLRSHLEQAQQLKELVD